MCLEQVKRCDMFLGVLGHRYGWKPSSSMVEDLPEEYDSFKTLVRDRGYSMTQLEMEYGVLHDIEAVRDKAFFYFRNDAYLEQVSPDVKSKYINEELEDDMKLNDLKKRIRGSGLEVMENYPVNIINGKHQSLEEFGERVLNNLWNSIRKLYPVKMETGIGQHEEELRQQLGWCKWMTKEFLGRTKTMDSLKEALDQCQGGVVNVTGAQGSGISALLATVAGSYGSKDTILPVLSKHSKMNSFKAVLQYLIRNLGKILDEEDNLQTLAVMFQQSIVEFAQSGRRVLIFLDALEDYDDFDLSAIPEHVPEHCILIIKTRSGGKLHSMLKKRNDVTEVVVKQLELKERADFAREMLNRKGKALEESAFNNQLLALVSKREASSPAYLRLAIDQLVKNANFDNLISELATLGSNTGDIINNLLSEAETLFGHDFISNMMLFLFQSVQRVSKSHIFNLMAFQSFLQKKDHKGTNISKMLDELKLFRSKGLSTISFIDVCLCLERMDCILDHADDQVKLSSIAVKPVHERFVKKCPSLTEVHSVMATVCVDHYNNDIIKPDLMLSMSHHLGACGDIKLLRSIICSPKYLQTKAKLGQGNLLLSDYLGKSLRFKSAQEKFNKDSLVMEYQEFIRTYQETIKYQPHMIPQLLMNEPQDSSLKSVEHIKDDDVVYLELKNGPKSKAERAQAGQVINKHAKNPTTFILQLKGMLVSGHANGSITVSDSMTYEDLFCLVGHSTEITGLALLSKNVLVSCSRDGLLSTWDLDKRIRLASVKAHERSLVSLSVRQPNIITAGWDGNIKVWDKRLGHVSTLSTSGPLNCVLVHPSKELCITGGWDQTIRIWDLASLKCKAIIRGHTSSVQSIRLSQDCRKIISGSLDGVVKIWDSSAGLEVASFQTGHGLTHLDCGPQVIQVAHTNGVVSTWPLALGRQVNSKKDKELSCQLWSHFQPDTDPSVRMMEATTLTRTVTALQQIGDQYLLGFDNGDVQLLEMKTMKNVNGWKVFSSRIDIVGGLTSHQLHADTTAMDWSDMMEDSSNSDQEDSDWPFLTTDSRVFTSAPHYSNKTTKSSTTTIWVVSENKVVVGSISDKKLSYFVTLGNIDYKVVDVIFHINDLLVFTQSGLLLVYEGHTSVNCGGQLLPKMILDTKHRSLTAVYLEGDTLVTVGTDNVLRVWNIDNAHDIALKSQTEETFLSNPVGVTMFKARQKIFLCVAFADGSLARIECKEGGQLSSPHMMEGNGQGVVRMSHQAGNILLHHTNGLVSLWTESGSEICWYDQRSTAALLTQDSHLVLANTNLTVISPRQSECQAKLASHHGPLSHMVTAQAGHPFTAGLDGKLVKWPMRAQQSACCGPIRDEIVAVTVSPVCLSLTKTGILTLHLDQAQQWTKLTSDKPSAKFQLMKLIESPHSPGDYSLVTCQQQGLITVWQLSISGSWMEATPKATLNLSQRVFTMNISKKQDEGLCITLITKELIYTLQYFKAPGTQDKYRMVTKHAMPITDYNFGQNEEQDRGVVSIIQTGLSSYELVVNGEMTLGFTLTDDGHLVQDWSKRTYLLHDQAATDVKLLVLKGTVHLVTCSEDGKLKMWRLEKDEEDDLVQVGEFIGHGPALTCLNTWNEDIVVGDKAGNVLYLHCVQS